MDRLTHYRPEGWSVILAVPTCAFRNLQFAGQERYNATSDV